MRPRGELLQELLGGLDRKRPGEQEALAAVAVLVAQERELVGLLDALGERLDRERLPELDESADQGFALVVVGETGNE